MTAVFSPLKGAHHRYLQPIVTADMMIKYGDESSGNTSGIIHGRPRHPDGTKKEDVRPFFSEFMVWRNSRSTGRLL
jgi:hypothetical protein